jgi:prepilin-type processing-associated H-X9-DG protein
MNRKAVLNEALLENYTQSEVAHFINYVIDQNDIDFLKESAIEVLSRVPQKAFNCTALSSLWGAIIKDNSKIPVAVICGHLDFAGKRIFQCNAPLPKTDDAANMGFWDGHCWLEFGGLIGDMSIFRTFYYGNVPDTLKKQIISQFGEGRGLIIASPETLLAQGFIYTPCYSLSDIQINGLIKGALEL